LARVSSYSQYSPGVKLVRDDVANTPHQVVFNMDSSL